MQAAWPLLSAGQDITGRDDAQAGTIALHFLNLHAHGCDLGLGP